MCRAIDCGLCVSYCLTECSACIYNVPARERVRERGGEGGRMRAREGERSNSLKPGSGHMPSTQSMHTNITHENTEEPQHPRLRTASKV